MARNYYLVHSEKEEEKIDTIVYVNNQEVAEEICEKIHFCIYGTDPTVVSSMKVNREIFYDKSISLTCYRGIVKSIDSISVNGEIKFTLEVKGKKDATIRIKPIDIFNWIETDENGWLISQSLTPGTIIEFDEYDNLTYSIVNPIIVPRIYPHDYVL